MKKLFFLFLLAIPSMTSAQLLVNSQGNVGIGDSINAISKFAVGCEGEVETTAKFYGKDNHLVKMEQGEIPDSIIEGVTNALHVKYYQGAWQKSYGINVQGLGGGDASSCIRTFAVRGYPSRGVAQNFGIAGQIRSDTYGAAVFGSSNYSYYPLLYSPYAGYFDGDVRVTGSINGVVLSDSDIRLKENVRELADEGNSTLATLDCLTPISYTYKPNTEYYFDEEEAEEAEIKREDITQNSSILQKTHYGFAAQELQEIYPDLVYEDNNGYFSVNYVELIPILVQSIRELNAKVEALQETNGYAKANLDDDVTAIDSPLTDAGTGVASMSQNIPNPFTDKTDIPIYLPESVKTATLCIYDLTGKQIEQHSVTGRGQTTMTIHADRMAAGMYLYALIADGKVVTSKRMIVSK